MVEFKKVLLFGVLIGLLLEQVYVIHYYFNVRYTKLDCLVVSDSLFQRISSAYSTLTIVQRDKYPNPQLHKIFCMIMSYPESEALRNTLRSTWISELATHTELGYTFVIGLDSISEETKYNLRLEEEAHHDIIFLKDHTDVELNITLKVLRSYVWAYENVKSEFLLKLRDDSYVAVYNLLKWLEYEPVPETGLVMGSFLWKQPVEKEDGRWSEPDWFVCPDTYLPFPRGEGYLASWDIVEFIHNYADDFRIYRHDDISLGIWLCGLKLTRMDSKKVIPDFEVGSICSSDVLIFGNMKSDDINNMHELWQTDKLLCDV